MSITVGLDFDGLIGNLRSYQKGGAQYDAWLDAIRVTPNMSYRKPARKDRVVRAALEEAHLEPSSPIYLKPVPGALETIHKLLELGFSLPVVTARTEEGAALASFWLIQQGLALPFHATHKDGTKRHALGRLGAIAHVDDTQSVLLDLRHDVLHRFLFAHGPYEHHVSPDLHFIASWSELEVALRELREALSF